ncbi:uncharacterized protein [Chelonus insularis]|uniref:uncharacterized protein n=1 Tax=Chelonus insularis TaxID=460826 RepID=UPI00158B34E1|nr:uncharacterized protein LOC118071377 [Chelonus insularis]
MKHSNLTRDHELNDNMDIQQDSADIIQSLEPQFVGVATKIDFYQKEVDLTHINMFSIIRDNGVACEAGTQTNISLKTSEKKVMIVKRTSEIGCESSIQYVDKKVGPNSLDGDDSLQVFQQGFQGLSSIKDNQDMIDLAGVSFSRFQLLFKAAGNCFTESISKNNMLLIFLMKMKLGLTYSSIRVLFGIHRTTVLRIFYTFFMYLADSCKNLIQWPSKFVNQQTMPECFRKEYPNCGAIIDCTEFKVEEPPEVPQRVFFTHTITIRIRLNFQLHVLQEEK